MEAEEADRELVRQTFKKFDEDGSNSIDLSELKNVMENLGVCMSETQLAELVEQVDANTNMELEFEEFYQLLTMWKDASKFKLFDEDGVESLSKTRMKNSLQTKLLLPDSWPRCAFDGLVALAACVYWVTVLLDDAWGVTNSFIAVEVLVSLLFVVDVVVCGFTSQLDGLYLADTAKETWLMYLRGWLIPDIGAAVPWDLIFQGSTAGRVLRHLRLLKVFKIPYLWKHSGRVPLNAGRIKFHFTILPVTLLLVQFVLVCHLFSIGFMLVKQFNGRDPLLNSDGVYPYDAALYYVIYTLYTVGCGDVDIDGQNEKAYCCLVLTGTILTNGLITGKLVSVMQKAEIQDDRKGKIRETMAALSHFQIPHSLQDEVLQFQDHLLAHSLSASYASIVEGLPEEMQSNIGLFVKLRLITSAPQFESAHYIVKVAIAEALVNTVVLPEQYVQILGESVTVMYFIAHGFIDTLADGGQHVATLHNDCYFGETALFGTFESRVSAKALTYCDLWGLHRSELKPLLRRFPRFNRLICELAQSYKEEGQVEIDGIVGSLSAGVFSNPETPAGFHSSNVDKEGKPLTSLASFVAWDEHGNPVNMSGGTNGGSSVGGGGSGLNSREPSSGNLKQQGAVSGGSGGPGSVFEGSMNATANNNNSTAARAKLSESSVTGATLLAQVGQTRRRRSSIPGAPNIRITPEEQLDNILSRLANCTQRMNKVRDQLKLANEVYN